MKKQLSPLLCEIILLTIMFIGSATAQNQKKTIVKQQPVAKADDVYIGGFFNQNGKKRMAGYMKNGIPVILTNGQYEAEVTAMAIVGGDVYATGVHNDKAVQWKNGQELILTPSPLRGRAYGIAVLKGDVYVVGASITKVYRIVYWKNGQEMGECGRSLDIKNSIAVDKNGDVYVASRDGFWRNGTEVDITGLAKNYFFPNDMKIVDGKIYAAGYVATSNYLRLPAYWEGGKGITKLPIESAKPTSYSSVSSMDVVGNDIYLSGWDQGQPKYWKNGVPFSIGESVSPTSIPDENMIAYINKDLYIISAVKDNLACLKNGKTFLSIDGSFIPKCLVGGKAGAK